LDPFSREPDGGGFSGVTDGSVMALVLLCFFLAAAGWRDGGSQPSSVMAFALKVMGLVS